MYVCINSCKASTEELRHTVLAMQAEQKRQGKALALADRHGSVTRQEVNADEFDRPNIEEIIEVFSAKFVAPAAVANSISPFMEECGLAPETWKLNSFSSGKDFQVQFLQNAFSGASHVRTANSKTRVENSGLSWLTQSRKQWCFRTCQTPDWKRPKRQRPSQEFDGQNVL